MNTSSRYSLLAGLCASALVGCGGGQSQPADTAPSPAPATTGTVTSRDIDRNPNTSVEEILKGRIAGVHVERTNDGGIAVRVRGSNTFQANSAPLYLLDGVAIEPNANGSIGVNPYDIESIKVLKDPASLTMYGVRGANGVVVIKTKKRTQ